MVAAAFLLFGLPDAPAVRVVESVSAVAPIDLALGVGGHTYAAGYDVVLDCESNVEDMRRTGAFIGGVGAAVALIPGGQGVGTALGAIALGYWIISHAAAATC